MDLFTKCERYTVPDDAKAAGIYPYFNELHTRQDTIVKMDGRDVIMLGSNNYLGLTSSDEVVQAGIKALEQYGSGCSGSRFLNGTLCLHTKFERELADFVGKDECMTFGTGFLTNLGIIAGITDRNDLIFSDKENHASIYDGCKLSYATTFRYNHADMSHLERLLKNAPTDKGKLIITDGVFSMSGDICNLPDIVTLAKKYHARVMVDDAHGFGVLGNHGRGTCYHFGLTDQVDIIMGTFSKSLASMGGFCVASERVINWLRHISRPYIFCASLAPVNTACANKALEMMRADDSRRKHLLEITAYTRAGLDKRGITYRQGNITPIIPIYTHTQEKTFIACKMLFENGVYVNPVIAPAVPENECVIRVSLMATHTKELIDKALDIIAKVLKNI